MAADYGNLGLIYRRRGDVDRAEAMHRHALQLNQELGRKEGIAMQYGNLGLIYCERGELERAETMFKCDLEFSEKLRSKTSIAAATSNLGCLYQQRGDTERACEYWEKARNLYTEIGMAPQVEQTEALMRDAGCPDA